MSMDNNSVMVNSPEGEVGYREAEYRNNYSGATQPIMNAAQSTGVTPQILVLLLSCAIKRCWKWAFFLGLILSSVGAAAAWLLFPVKYESTAWIFAYSQVPYTVFQTPEARGEYESFLETQFTMIKSPQLLKEVLQLPRMAQVKELVKQKDPIKWLEKNIIVSRQRKSEYFTISFKDANPDDALAVTAAVMEVYMKRYKNDTEKREGDLTANGSLHETV